MIGDGEMIGCDGSSNCLGNNWFHPKCVGLGKSKPRGAWFCEVCKSQEGLLEDAVSQDLEKQKPKKTHQKNRE